MPAGRLLLDDPRVVLDVGRARHAVDERRDVGRPPDTLEHARAAEFFLERHEIDRQAALAERDHLVEDQAMRLAEEVLAVDQLGGLVDRVVAQHDGAEHRALGIEIVWQRARRFEDVGHGSKGRRACEEGGSYIHLAPPPRSRETRRDRACGGRGSHPPAKDNGRCRQPWLSGSPAWCSPAVRRRAGPGPTRPSPPAPAPARRHRCAP